MESFGFIIILLIIAIPIYLLKRFISRKISQGVDNAFNSIAAHRKNKQYQQQGPQNLADRFAGTQAQQPQDPAQQPQDQQNPFNG
jgi:hypothetical protein